ncbi:unnamed protein product [Effrenium voratum]|nr:unnamed protein product [Effrenium voratum]
MPRGRDGREDEDAGEFQKSPVRGRPMVNKLVPKKLTRTTTDDTQTAINRVVHEAVARSSGSGSKGYAARATMGAVEKEDLAEDVRQRVQLVIEAKEDELIGKITHQQRLELIRLVATQSVDEALMERQRMERQAAQAAEEKVRMASFTPVMWRRLLCSYLLPQEEVLTLGSCSRFLRQDHALGLQTLILPGWLPMEEEKVSLTHVKPMPPQALKELAFKFRYAQTLLSRRGCRLLDTDLALLAPRTAQLRRLDLSFARRLSQEPLLEALKSCKCLAELSVRGCNQLQSKPFEGLLGQELKGLEYLDVRGCEQLVPASIQKAAVQVHSLRFGFEVLPQLWPFNHEAPMTRLDLASWDLGGLRCLELDLGLLQLTEEQVNEDVARLATCRTLDLLLLWNVIDLRPSTFKALLRNQKEVDTMVLEDCYHHHDSYFHLVPSAWGLDSRDKVDAFSAASFFPAGVRGGKAVVAAVNVCREPNALIEAMAGAVAELGVQHVHLINEHDNDVLQRLAGPQVQSFHIRCTVNLASDSYSAGFLCPFLRACPNLRRFRLFPNAAHFAGRGLDLEPLLQELSSSCVALESLEVPSDPADKWREKETYHPVIEYDAGESSTARAQKVSLAVLQELLEKCPQLTQLQLPPPKGQSCFGFWRHCCDGPKVLKDMAQRRLDFCTPTLLPQELEGVLQVVADIAPERLCVNHQAPFPEGLAFALRSGPPLLALRVQHLPRAAAAVLANLLQELPEHSPQLEELALGHMSFTEEEAERLADALLGFRNLKELLYPRGLCEAAVTALNEALPQIMRHNRGLQKLHCCDISPKLLLQAVTGCHQLRKLLVLESQEGKAKLDISVQLLQYQLITRCPLLRSLMVFLKGPDIEDEADEERLTRETLLQGRSLKDLGNVNVDCYRGIQYNDGQEPDPTPPSESEDED